jgi:hypothetical protein
VAPPGGLRQLLSTITIVFTVCTYVDSLGMIDDHPEFGEHPVRSR